MKLLVGPPFDQWRDSSPAVVTFYGHAGDATCGVFNVPMVDRGIVLRVIASQGEGWDHVSVSIPNTKRCPTWGEMQFVKRAFFKRNEWAFELHPPEAKNISVHDYCLHLWWPNLGQIVPLPEAEMVG